MRIRPLGIAIVAAATVTSAAVAAPAAAATPVQVGRTGQSGARVLLKSVTVRGVVRSVNTYIAAAHGYTAQRRADGTVAIYETRALVAERRTLHVTSSALSSQVTARVRPFTVVTPNTGGSGDGPGCGKDFVHLYWFINSNGKYQEETGFEDAIPPSIGYGWHEQILVTHDGRELQSYGVNQSGALAFDDDWTGQHTATNTDTSLTVTVVANGEYNLSDGVACFFTSPNVTEIVPAQ